MRSEATAAFSFLILFGPASCVSPPPLSLSHQRLRDVYIYWLFKKLVFTFIGPLYYILVFCFIRVLCLQLPLLYHSSYFYSFSPFSPPDSDIQYKHYLLPSLTCVQLLHKFHFHAMLDIFYAILCVLPSFPCFVISLFLWTASQISSYEFSSCSFLLICIHVHFRLFQVRCSFPCGPLCIKSSSFSFCRAFPVPEKTTRLFRLI